MSLETLFYMNYKIVGTNRFGSKRVFRIVSAALMIAEENTIFQLRIIYSLYLHHTHACTLF